MPGAQADARAVGHQLRMRNTGEKHKIYAHRANSFLFFKIISGKI